MLEHPAVRALLLSFAAGLSTLLGALVVFFTKTKSQKLLAISLGFAAGVMLSVSFTDLYPNARDLLDQALGAAGTLAAVASLAGGVLLAMALDHFVP